MNLLNAQTELERIFDQANSQLNNKLLLGLADADWGIYGAGRTGLKAAKILRKKGKKILFFMDVNAQKNPKVDGVLNFLPREVPLPLKEAPILVAVHNSGSDAFSLKKDLIKAGFSNVFLLQEAMGLFIELAHFWLDHPLKTLTHANAAREGVKLWADDESRQAYCSILAFRLLGEPCPSFELDQYFPSSVPTFEKPLRWVDCGAFDGDTLDYVTQRHIEEEWVVAFEPDPKNYEKLASKHSGRGFLVPCGVSDGMRLASFSSDGSASALSKSSKDSTIQLCSLDDTIGSMSPNFIKMDIEGAELDAIEGARDIIKKHQPRLAIASYHHPHHLWEVAQKSAAVGFRGEFMLRIHALNTFEVITYGIEP